MQYLDETLVLPNLSFNVASTKPLPLELIVDYIYSYFGYSQSLEWIDNGLNFSIDTSIAKLSQYPLFTTLETLNHHLTRDYNLKSNILDQDL